MRWHTFTAAATLIGCLIGLTGLIGCGDSEPVLPPDAGGDNEPKRRVVSLSPALTKMIVDIGRADALVGVIDDDAALPADMQVSRVGRADQVDRESILLLDPTHIVTMAGSAGPPEGLADWARTNGIEFIAFEYPESVNDIGEILMGPMTPDPTTMGLVDKQSLLGLLDEEGLGMMMVNDLLFRRLSRISVLTDAAVHGQEKPRVLVAHGLEPRLRASGPNTVFHDVLTGYLGARNAAIPDLTPDDVPIPIDDSPAAREAARQALEALDRKLGTSIVMDREKLLKTKADVIVLLLPGAPPLEDLATDPRLADLRGLDIPAVQNGRIYLINDPQAVLESTSLPSIAAEMAKVIHPSIADEIDSAMEGDTTSDDPANDEATKDGEMKEGETKDGAVKDGAKDAKAKDDAPKDGAMKDGESKDGAVKDGEPAGTTKDDAAKDAKSAPDEGDAPGADDTAAPPASKEQLKDAALPAVSSTNHR